MFNFAPEIELTQLFHYNETAFFYLRYCPANLNLKNTYRSVTQLVTVSYSYIFRLRHNF
jgi:hypothetical protein